ncbi:CRISPR-associated protein Cas4-2 [Methanobrevibacter ruminantium M1]|uniref:CRISPR-associated protein Cas4-2 n=1 Tax=Methanobrevibacter ruminantium (strain ATCC 35063 / DSM 1093 / JCM 13430 / OCM 146 / M1) TaxID=634498 RepID=D3E4D8_METRM|nr:Dna2/Cas4 domain-containing protein [Methanobrevibacter ruminantium]ADC47399.1 CRISPR-associated protein Cas4-2 [Methanobrevibacter ruminantium M1]
MENKLIRQDTSDLDIVNHPEIKGLQIIEGKINFPISWLNQQGYCEYTLYLQYLKGIKTMPTQAMTTGTKEHLKLEEEFKQTATPSSFDDAFKESKEKEILSREMFVIDSEEGVRGFIDEIWMTPDEIVIIDDKPGNRAYPSSMNQVRAYCLAFKNMIGDDNRIIRGALRQRGTDNIFWSEIFDEKVEENILYLIHRMHGLFEGTKPFIPTKNGNKCRACRYQSYCEHKVDI